MKSRTRLLLIFLFCFTIESYAQCAMCRAVLESAEGQGPAKAINDGIVYLMAIPYLLIGGLAFFIYKKYNRSNTPTTKRS